MGADEFKETKKITLGLVFSWVFGVMFAISGFGALVTASYALGVAFLLMAAILLPPVNDMLKEKYRIELSGGVKIIIVLVLMVMVGGMMMNTAHKSSPITEKNPVNNPRPVDTKDTAVNTPEIPTVTGKDSKVNGGVVQTTPSAPANNPKTEYLKNYLKLEDVEVGEGYGQYDMPGYSEKKPTVQGKIRNTGNRSLDTIQITVYFLDSNGTRIGEHQYQPISTYAIMGDKTPLKPNYVRDWGYVVDTIAPSGWAKTIEVMVSDITFTEE